MELIARIRHRVGYVWYWRVRHFWIDTQRGFVTRIGLSLLAGIVGVLMMVRALWWVRTAPIVQPHQAVIGVIIVLIIALLAAVIALATMPKPKPPQPQKANTPTVEDGQSVQDHGGTFWVDDSFILAWKQMPTEPIQTDGGKK